MKIFLLSILATCIPYVAVGNTDVTGKKEDHTIEYEKIISQFQEYVASVPKEVREEVMQFRKNMVKVNKQKKQLYKSLSQEAQLFLKKEQLLKQKLPINKKRNLSTPIKSEISEN